MRTLRWLPLAYLAGAHGFAIFAPYAALLVAVCHLTSWRRKRAFAAPGGRKNVAPIVR